MKLRIYKHSLYKKMFLYIAILVLVTILSLFFVSYTNFENVGLKMQYTANLNILSEISYSATYLDDIARNTAAYIYSNTDYSALRYGDSTNMEDAYQLTTDLEVLVAQYGNVHSIYIYNGDIDTFYSTWGRFYSSSEEFVDRDMVDTIHNNKIPGKEKFTSTPMLRKIPISYNDTINKTYMNTLTYVMSEYSPDKGRIQSAIIINLNSQYLDGLINTLNTKGALTGGDTIILNSSGYAVASSNSGSAFSDFTNKKYVQKILNSKAKNGYFIDVVNGQKVVITYVSSDVLDWKFVNITPYSQIFREINILKRNLYLACMGVVILGFLLSYLVARYLYHPINSMMGKVQKLSNVPMGKNRKNEIDFITEVITESFEKTQNLQSINYENNTIKKSGFLRELLVSDTINEATVTEMFRHYKIAIDPDGSFILCNFCIDSYLDFSQNLNIEDQRLFRFAICNIASELALKYYKNECFDIDDKNIMLIIEVSEPDQNIEEKNLIETVREIQDACQTYLNISLSAAFNIEPAKITDISDGYDFTQRLSKYRLVYGYKSILLPEDILRLKTDAFEHPIILEQKLDEALNNGKLDDAIEVYDKIIEYITDYSFETINSYILYLSYLIIKKFNDLESKGYEKIIFDSNGYIREIMSLETLSEINDRVVSLFKLISDTIEQKRFRRKNSVVERVKSIIDNEYMDKNLCQDLVANRLNISRDYLGKMFREAYSKSFADYLTEVRLQKAVELMGNSKISISEIMDKIGWENKNYFYTTFKQKFGVTTSQYRNININN